MRVLTQTSHLEAWNFDARRNHVMTVMTRSDSEKRCEAQLIWGTSSTAIEIKDAVRPANRDRSPSSRPYSDEGSQRGPPARLTFGFQGRNREKLSELVVELSLSKESKESIFRQRSPPQNGFLSKNQRRHSCKCSAQEDHKDILRTKWRSFCFENIGSTCSNMLKLVRICSTPTKLVFTEKNTS